MKIAYTGSHFPEQLKQTIKQFMLDRGYDLDLLTLKSRDAWDSKEMLSGYDVIICSGETYGENIIRYLSPTLRMLSRHGVGTDEIAKDVATQLGIAVCNAAGSLSSCVAECALALILNTLHGYCALDRDTRAGEWNVHDAWTAELPGLTVGLLGFGGIAQRLARFLSGFDCKLLAYDPYFNAAAAEKLNVKETTLDELRTQSDVISIHVPLTDETRALVDAAFLRGMKPTAILINTSRGGIVKEPDLVEALQTGVIAGAGLDVFEQEPTDVNNPLFALRNVTLLPHVASHTYDSQLAAALMACRNAIAVIEGKQPESLLNPDYIHCK